jgi:REP element-mobilizing transposase RayT
MTSARFLVVRDGIQRAYHCISRCVRRSFLCGYDDYAHKDYEHRKGWIRDQLQLQANIFALDICGYAIMSNHLHLVLRTRPDLAASWDDRELARRWRLRYPLRTNPLTGMPEEPNELEIQGILCQTDKLPYFRERLASLSCFMGCLNESIARRANAEDNCKGRFWEGRFTCVALLDDPAILSCLSYVDLNPIRAAIAETPEKSYFTSGHDRILAAQAQAVLAAQEAGGAGRRAEGRLAEASPAGTKPVEQAAGEWSRPKQTSPEALSQEQLRLLAELRVAAARADWLCPLQSTETRKGFLNLPLQDYFALLDWTGRQMRKDKPGSIPGHLEPILIRMEIEREAWLDTVQHFGSHFRRVAGKLQNVAQAAREVGLHWFKGKRACAAAFSSPAS